jgi:hypothetical protein
MKKSVFNLIVFCILAWVLSACLTITFQNPTSSSIPPTTEPSPAKTTNPLPSLSPFPTFTPIILPPTSTPSQGATNIRIFLIALEDNGATGKKIGCNDSVIPVLVNIEPTLGVLRASLNELFKLEGQRYYGLSGFYNSLYQSHLSIDSLNILNREAIIKLKGTLTMGGACDNPRVKAQLEEIALQFKTVDKVSIFVNGIPLDQLLSGQG